MSVQELLSVPLRRCRLLSLRLLCFASLPWRLWVRESPWEHHRQRLIPVCPGDVDLACGWPDVDERPPPWRGNLEPAFRRLSTLAPTEWPYDGIAPEKLSWWLRV